jgi:acetyl esterase/lipase
MNNNNDNTTNSTIDFSLSPYYNMLLDTCGLINDCNQKIAFALSLCLDKEQTMKQMGFLLESIQSLLLEMFDQEQREVLCHSSETDRLCAFDFNHRGLLLRLSFLLSKVHSVLLDQYSVLFWKKKERISDLIQEIEIFNVLLSCSFLLKQKQIYSSGDCTLINRWLTFGSMDKNDWELLASLDPSVFLKYIEDTPFGPQKLKTYMTSFYSNMAAYSKLAGIPKATRKNNNSESMECNRRSPINCEGHDPNSVSSMKGKFLSLYYSSWNHGSASLRADELFKNMPLLTVHKQRNIAQQNSTNYLGKLIPSIGGSGVGIDCKLMYIQPMSSVNDTCEYCTTIAQRIPTPNTVPPSPASDMYETNDCNTDSEVITLVETVSHHGLDTDGNSTRRNCLDLFHIHFHQDPSTIIREPIALKVLATTKLTLITENDTEIITCRNNHSSGPDCILLHISEYDANDSHLQSWAKNTGAVVIKIEFDDMNNEEDGMCFRQIERCFMAYKWIVEHSHAILGRDLRKLVLSGDGITVATAISVIMRCIVEQVRLPDLCMFCCPWTYIPLEMTCSRWSALLPTIAELNYLRRCSELYMGSTSSFDDQIHCDPWISPAIAPIEFLTQFPMTYIAVASLDPLMDDGIFIARRISKHNRQCVKLEVSDGLDHGFLQLAGQVPEISTVVKRMGDFISRTISTK